MEIREVVCENGYHLGNYFDYPCGSDHKIIEAQLEGMVFHVHNMVHVVDVFQEYFKRLMDFENKFTHIVKKLNACNTNKPVCSDFYRDVFVSDLKKYTEFIIQLLDEDTESVITKLSEIPKIPEQILFTEQFSNYIRQVQSMHIDNNIILNFYNSIKVSKGLIKLGLIEFKNTLDNYSKDSETVFTTDRIFFRKIQELFDALFQKCFMYFSVIRKTLYFMKTIDKLFSDHHNSYLVFISEYDETDKFFLFSGKNFMKSNLGFSYTHDSYYIGDCNITKNANFKEIFSQYNSSTKHFDASEFKTNPETKCTDAYLLSSKCTIFYDKTKLTELDYNSILNEANSVVTSDLKYDANCTLYCSLFRTKDNKQIFAVSLKFRNGALNGANQYYYFTEVRNRLYDTLNKLKETYINNINTLYVLIGGDFNNMYYAKSKTMYEGPPVKNGVITSEPVLGKVLCDDWEMGNWCKVERSNIHEQIETTVTEILSKKINHETHSIQPYTHSHNGQDIMKIFGWKISRILPDESHSNRPQEGGYYDKYIKYKTKYLQLKNLSRSI